MQEKVELMGSDLDGDCGTGASRDRMADVPVAIVGMHCRFPGSDGPEALWELLASGREAISETPADRWDAAALYHPDATRPGTINTLRGGYVTAPLEFDAEHFGISPREALNMDPQHRVMLEVTWHALEDAGLSEAALAGSRTGVWVSVYQRDFARLALADRTSIDAYTASGTHHSLAANRISYLLDLRGPSMTVDTACSSSLVAFATACRALVRGEVDRAIVAASNLMLEPAESVSLARWGILAPDGRCKTFDASADGFVRGEGCAAIVLERAADVRAAGRTERARVLGAAINQDGRSNGMTAPNGGAQQDAVRQALADAQLDPHRVTYVETHGTGTVLGDPIELEALSAVLGRRAGHPGCRVGSLKTNIGHLEAAAGLAGVVKTVLCLENREIPASLNFETLNPHIELGGTPLAVAQERRVWRDPRGPLVAGVSAFGMGGTNAHAILSEAASSATGNAEPTPASPPRPAVLALSASCEEALAARVAGVERVLEENDDARVDELCAAAARTTQRAHRAAVVGRGAAELAARLRERGASMASGGAEEAGPGDSGVVFVFAGQGSQWVGMGRALCEEEPTFRAEMDRCDRALRELAGWSLFDALTAGEGDERWQRIDVIQPLLFSLQVSLARLLRSWGLEPDAVVGHSMGEAAAAAVSGALTIEDALRVIVRRTELMVQRRDEGAMWAVNLSSGEAAEAIRGHEDRLSVAVVNGPSWSVLSGAVAPLDGVIAALEARGVVCRPIAVNVASHSPAMEAFLRPLTESLVGIQPREGDIPFYSTVAACPLSGRALLPRYWYENLRRPVRFWDTAQRLLDDGHRMFVEVGPHPILLSSLGEGTAVIGTSATLVPVCRRGADEAAAVREAAAALWERGVTVDLPALAPADPGRTRLPAYPFQRREFPLPTPPELSAAPTGGDPLLGRRIELAHEPDGALFALELSTAVVPFVDDHTVEGEPVLPGTGSVGVASAAARALWPDRPPVLEDVTFLRPILFPEGETVSLQLRVHGDRFELRGRDGADAPWNDRVTGKYASQAARPEALDVAATLRRCPRELDDETFYGRLNASGNTWEGAFQGVRRAWIGDGEALGEIVAPEAIACDLERYAFHPALLDSCGHVLSEVSAMPPGPFVLADLERAALWGPPQKQMWGHVVARPEQRAGSLVVDIRAYDRQGTPLAELVGLRIQFLRDSANAAPLGRTTDWLHSLEWASEPVSPDSLRSGGGGRPLRVVGRGPLAEALRAGADHGPSPAASPADVVYATEVVGDGAEGALALCWEAVEVLRSLSAGERLWIATRGAAGPEPTGDPREACLWGLTQAIAAESSSRFGGIVDVDAAEPAAAAALAVRGYIAASRGEPRVAIRGGRRLVPRLQQTSPGGSPELARPLARTVRPDAAYVVTGGLGGLGARVARRLVERGARHLVLLGRRGLPPRIEWARSGDERCAEVLKMEALGASVTTVSLDVGDPTALGTFAESWRAEARPPVRGVIHAAGVQRRALLSELTHEDLAAELHAKVGGALAIDAVWGGQLDFCVLYSSTATLLDSPMLGGYCAANAFLDALAAARHAQGRAVFSVDWGIWAEVGMAPRFVRETGRSLTDKGVGAMPPERALDALEIALSGGAPRVGVMPIDWAVWSENHPGAAAAPVLAEVVASAGAVEESPGGDGDVSLNRSDLATVAPEERARLVSEGVRQRLARVLRADAAGLDMERPLTRLGLDSLMALELRNGLERDLGIDVPVVFLLQCRAGALLAERVLEALDALGAADVQRAPGIAPSGGGAPGAVEVDGAADGDWDELVI